MKRKVEELEKKKKGDSMKGGSIVKRFFRKGNREEKKLKTVFKKGNE